MKEMKGTFALGLLALLAGSLFVPSLRGEQPNAAQVKAFGNFYPERDDDLAWENDLIGFRAYGPAKVSKGERVYGYDVWLKRGGADPFLPAAYWMDIVAHTNYHHDHGRGMDCYAVGPTLGAGTAALLMTDSRGNDSIAYEWAYESAKILENGPERFRAELVYPSGERREITLEAGHHLNRTEVWWPDSLLSRAKAVIVGFPIHEPSHAFHVLEDADFGALTYLDPTQGNDNGELYLGAAVPGGFLQAGEMLGHAAMVAPKPAPGQPFVYRWGAGWNRADVPSHEAWDEMVKKEIRE